MEAVRKTIDSSLLNDVIPLPKGLQNRKVEVIIFPAEEKTTLPLLKKSDIDILIKGSVTETLIGALPFSEKSDDEYRAERLNKYEYTD